MTTTARTLIFRQYEPASVLKEVNGVSRYRDIYAPWVEYVSCEEDDLEHSNVDLESWLESTFHTGYRTALAVRDDGLSGSLRSAVSQPGMAMGFAEAGVPFTWFVKNNVGFAESALIPECMEDHWEKAFEQCDAVVFEGVHALDRFRQSKYYRSIYWKVHYIPVPLHPMHMDRDFMPRFQDTDPIALVIGPPVPWKTDEGRIIEWMEQTQDLCGWVWVTSNMSPEVLQEIYRRARIGVHLSTGESLSLVTQEHLWYHPTFVLSSHDDYHLNWSEHARACMNVGDLRAWLEAEQFMTDPLRWATAVWRQREALSKYRVVDFAVQMDRLVEKVSKL